MHALIIEKDAFTILMIEDVLREAGFTSFDFAASAGAALAAAEARCPDLITADVRLGAENGLEAVQAICSGREIPVVFVTEAPWEVREKRPTVAVVPKPFCASGLKDAIRQARAALSR